jgi:hypothetical protein
MKILKQQLIYFILLVAANSIIGCKPDHLQSENNNSIQNIGSIHLSYFVDSIFNQFVKENNNGKAYAIYFDKKDPYEYKILIAMISPLQDFKKESGVLNYFIIKDSIPVILISGIEDFISIENDDGIKELEGNYKIIASRAIVKTSDTLYVVEDDHIPFMKMRLGPTIKFEPPKDH